MVIDRESIPYDVLLSVLDHKVQINYGALPINNPKDIEDLKVLRILIGVLRQAGIDYLDPKIDPDDLQEAIRTLFGIHDSPLAAVCKLLGIDCRAARLKLIECKVTGKRGDQLFAYLTKPDSLDRYEKGADMDIPRL